MPTDTSDEHAPSMMTSASRKDKKPLASGWCGAYWTDCGADSGGAALVRSSNSSPALRFALLTGGGSLAAWEGTRGRHWVPDEFQDESSPVVLIDGVLWRSMVDEDDLSSDLMRFLFLPVYSRLLSYARMASNTDCWILEVCEHGFTPRPVNWARCARNLEGPPTNSVSQ